jgi:hypothetical protein
MSRKQFPLLPFKTRAQSVSQMKKIERNGGHELNHFSLGKFSISLDPPDKEAA